MGNNFKNKKGTMPNIETDALNYKAAGKLETLLEHLWILIQDSRALVFTSSPILKLFNPIHLPPTAETKNNL